MTTLFYMMAMVNAAIALIVAVIGFWRNRYQPVGALVGIAMAGASVWTFCFSRYFLPLNQADALWWSKATLIAAVMSTPPYFHLFATLAGKARPLRWWIVLSYLTGLVFVALMLQGQLIDGLRPTPHMDHYLQYNRAWYPWLILHIAGWQVAGTLTLLYAAWTSVGYRRTQLMYFIATWMICFISNNLIVIPIEYNLYIPPVGFFIMPLSLGLLAYAVAKARLADFNVAVARLLVYLLTLVVIALVSLVFVAVTVWLAPGFIGTPQILFVIGLVLAIGTGLVLVLPRFLPRVERLVEDRLIGARFSYQDTLTGLVKELSHQSSLDAIFATVVGRLHAEMQLSRVMMLIHNPLSGDYELLEESGLSPAERADTMRLTAHGSVAHWLERQQDVLVRDELPRLADEPTRQALEAELDHLGATVCVPLLVEGRLLGAMALGGKLNREMFYAGDIRLLETLAAEVALAVRYRRMEEQVLHQNKLIELGTIAAGIAHEIRNPLASIRTFAQLLPDKATDPEFQNEFRRMVLQDVDRITKVIQSMLAFARPGTINIAEYSAVELVDEAVMLVVPHLKSKRIELTKQFHEVPRLRVDKQLVIQVLVNLLTNAADALPEGGRIRIATGAREMEALDRPGRQKFAIIEVADNGPGVAPAVRHRLFDPFFTTKPEGTGLGLSISQKIVRDHGGIITVSSVEGKGTSFQVNLPLDLDPNKFVQTDMLALEK
jgi:signal transduction histidine kinase